MRTSNPALNDKVFNDASRLGAGQTMTLQGTVNKTFVLLGLLVFSAAWVWGKILQPAAAPLLEGIEGTARAVPPSVGPLMMLGVFGGMIVGFVTIFKKTWAPVTAPVYALCEGLFIGGISAIFEIQYPGIVLQAVALTFGALFCLLTAYKSGMIRPTENFKLGLVAATGAICLVYFVNLIMGFFGASIPMIYSSGPFGIIFSLIVVTVAALNLVLDFDFIERGASMNIPKYMEWYAAFGLIVTLVWLYIEILRLLAKLRDRR
ncbi:MAG TPA: Bax inhibitor-1/YccA family protein [Candidatus Omnitrophota bacterium]|nr:Bax inhibitor-1/YccA family protein [Candidatus Omnitrophota bacterium]